MRSKERIKPFMEELAKLWEEKAPDMRFGQLIDNIFNSLPDIPFYTEDEELLEQIKDFFDRLEKEGNK